MTDLIGKNKKLLAHTSMIFLVFIWGFDYVPAKWALEMMPPNCLMLFKFGIGFLFLLAVKILTGNRALVRKKDIPLFIACAVMGQVLYFECEYTAMDYIPVSLLTIILAFLPAFSVVLERIIYKRKANKKIYIGIAACLVGIVIVVGDDFSVLFQGRGLGYLLAVGAVFTWNAYNFITAKLEDYDSVTLSATQCLCTTLIMLPLAIPSMPGAEEFNPLIIGGLAWVGLADSGIGYLILVNGIKVLGPTPSALYSNFLPVTTALFGALFLGETITWLQIAGGIIVIASGFVVIKEKGRLDELREKQKENQIVDGD